MHIYILRSKTIEFMFVPVWSPIKLSKHGSVNFPPLAGKPKNSPNRTLGLFQRKKLDISSHNRGLTCVNDSNMWYAYYTCAKLSITGKSVIVITISEMKNDYHTGLMHTPLIID